MPKVTHRIRFVNFLVGVAVACATLTSAQTGDDRRGPAESLYEQLRSVGLDRTRVYKIRDASLDRLAIHLALNDGTIAFTEDVAGRITGAFFAGDGEVLLSPPNQIERSSMALFTGSAILEEKFATAYLRFNDDTFKQLEPSLRPSDNPNDFIGQWNDTAKKLAGDDALRLLMTFSRLLPLKGGASASSTKEADDRDRMFHLRVQGLKLGIFDLFFDALATEQISAGQVRKVDQNNFYDVWTSFATGGQHAEDATSEIAGEEEGRGDIEISHYKISTKVKPPTQLEVEAHLKISVQRGGDRAVLFELSRYLKVHEVSADGIAVEFIHNPSLEGTQLERRGDDLVAIVFSRPLRSGEKIELGFKYEGPVLSEAGGGLLYVGARGTWYPNRGFSKATFDLDFQYPAPWTLVATGRKENGASVASTSGGLMQNSRWTCEKPIPVAGFNLGKYSKITRPAGPVLVDVYAAPGMERSFPQLPADDEPAELPTLPSRHAVPMFIAPPPPSPAANAQAVGDETVRALTFFAERFGPYPFPDLSVTQMPGSLSQGWPGLIFLSSFSFLSSSQKSALRFSPLQQTVSNGVIAHETAHQWWGDSVTWSGYRNQWVMEALANYSSMMLLESQSPARFRALMEKYKGDLLAKNHEGLRLMDAGPVTLGTRLISSKFPDGYEIVSYERGTWLFHMLRAAMRDAEPNSPRKRGTGSSSKEPFSQALRAIRDRYQVRPISTQALFRVFEEYLPPSASHDDKKSLDWFLQGWVNGTAIPTLQVHSLKYSDKPQSTIVTGVISQKDAPEDLVTSVPIYAGLNGKNVFLGRVFTDGEQTPFRLTAPLGIRKILLDPERNVLCRTH